MRARRCSRRWAASACRPPRDGRWPRRRAATRCSWSSSSPTSTSNRRADALPPALHALLAARLDRLDATERAALALGAVAGDTFTAGSVHALATGLTRAEVEQRVRAAARARPARARAPPRHAALPAHADPRRRLRRAGEVRARRAARAPRRLARGLGGRLAKPTRGSASISRPRAASRPRSAAVPAELAARAGERLAAAAGAAHARGDLAGEIGFLDRAVALLGDDDPRGAALLPGLVSALFESGASDRADTLADRAVRVTGALGLERVHAHARIEREHIRLSCHPETFRPERSRAEVSEAVATMRRLGDELGLARAAYTALRSGVADRRPGGVLPPRRRDARLRARGGQRLRRRDGARVHGLVHGRGPVAGARGDRAAATRWSAMPSARGG